MPYAMTVQSHKQLGIW